MSIDNCQLVEELINECRSIIAGINENSDKCCDYIKNFRKTFKFFDIAEDSAIKKLRNFMLIKYLSTISLFILCKATGKNIEIDLILKKLNECVIELEKTKYLSVKEEKLQEIAKKNKTTDNSEANILPQKSRPNLKNLIPKPRHEKNNSDDEESPSNSDDVEDETTENKYIPPKDIFVPYPFDKKANKRNFNGNDTCKSNLKHDVISNVLREDSDIPIEVNNNSESLDQHCSKKNKTSIDSRLRYMENDLEMEHLAEDFLLKGLHISPK
ncbi:hypothetical protein HZS_845 [Henneguya salminicola]|nr:hypothetical protein HZS_845 [Henneguya salminicola]